MAQQPLARLPITLEHAVRVGLLPLHHRDPFDRLLVAQAQSLKLPILSADAALDDIRCAEDVVTVAPISIRNSIFPVRC